VESRSLPVAVVVGSVRYSGIAAGRFHSLGLATDGKVYGWGGNGFGQLGDGTTDGRLEPVLASGLSGLAQGVSAGWVHSVVLMVGAAAAWISSARWIHALPFLAIALFVLTRLPSGNVWDAVADPLLWLYLHVHLATQGWRYLRGR
jgi:hypothetical protein